jgi:phenylacetate-CoA ligase
MGRLETVYAGLPVWAQHGAVSAYGTYWYWMRFGPGYTSYLNEYLARERFDRRTWQDWQAAEVRAVLRASAESVPYYRETWTRTELAAARAGRLHDLPLLQKEAVRSRAESFIRTDRQPWPRLVFHTSGSTGTPIATVWDARELRRAMALREARSAAWAGVSFRLPRATFSGRMSEPDPDSKGPFYRFNIVERQAYFSPFHLRADTAERYVHALRRHRIQWLTGYAVSYYLLARFILEAGLKVTPLRAVVTTSEKVTVEMRKTIERAFGCPVFEEYSTVENVVFASECEHHRLHLSPDAAVVEILRPDGTPCEPGEIGEVVATGLLRVHQPLVRYRLGDLAMWDPDPCPCGREMPVIKEVVGRIEDVLVGPDGRQMVRFHGVFVDQPHVREGQIIQEAIDRIRVKVVPSDGFRERDVSDVARRVRQRMGTEVEVIVETVDRIPRTAGGKFQAVISRVQSGAPQ